MTAIDSGSRFWDLNFKRPLDSLDVSPEARDLLRQPTFVTPLPFVKRVVFLATPHRGLDQMNPRNEFLKTLAGISLAPGVVANSIIAVQGSGPVEDGEDGVVAYRSAHLEGVESDLVVRSGHSLQDQAETVEEVRPILLLHARDVP